jgi:hypothetical protein
VPIVDHVKANPVTSVAILILTVLGAVNVTTVVQTVRFVDGLATKQDVSAAALAERNYAASELESHTAQATENFDGIKDELKRVRAFTEIVPELRDLLKLKCMGTPNLDITIDRLKREYRELTKETFIEPPCARLLASVG